MVVHFNFAKDLLSFFHIVEWVVGTRSVWMGQGKGSQYTYLILKVKESCGSKVLSSFHPCSKSLQTLSNRNQRLEYAGRSYRRSSGSA